MNDALSRVAEGLALGDPLQNRTSAASCAHVTVVGLGGLGCPAASGLAASGIGKLTLIDPDRVELSNLPRQLLHGEPDVGRHKVESAADTLRATYPTLVIECLSSAVTADNAADLFAATDFVIDATDGTATKLMINDAALRAGRAYCHAGVVGFAGQLMTVIPGASPCLRCVFTDLDRATEEADVSCRQAGIIGPVAGLIGALQANLAVRYLAGDDGSSHRLYTYDGLADRWRDLDTSGLARCAVCTDTARHRTRSEGDGQRWAT